MVQNITTLITNNNNWIKTTIHTKRQWPNCSVIYVRVSYLDSGAHSKNININKSLIKTDVPFNIALLMALAVEAHLAEGQLQCLETTLN